MNQYHLNTTPSITRKKRRRKKTGEKVEVFEKLDRKTFKSSNKIPSYRIPAGRDTTAHIPSAPMTHDPNATARRSMVEHALSGKESQQVADEIIRKSRCIAPTVNKGPVQYIGSTEAARDAGR